MTEKIGLETILDNADFVRGLNQYMKGMSDLESKTKDAAITVNEQGNMMDSAFGQFLGDKMTQVVDFAIGTIARFVSAIAGAFQSAAGEAMQFQETMANTFSLFGPATEQAAALTDMILQTGMAARAGPQEAAQAYYDIVSGVADATMHVEIFNAAIALSEAGNSQLAGATSVLVGTMNAYGDGIESAAAATDIMLRTVGMGVLTMDQLAAALPNVTSIAAATGISFEELSANLALMTTKGFDASASANSLRQSIVALINPNANMTAALEELGYASGQAALDALGLAGAYEAIAGTQAVAENGMAATVGSVEALNAALTMTGDGAQDFVNTFTSGIEGATEAARAIQLETAAAQLDLLKSKAQGLSIMLGNQLGGAFGTLLKAANQALADNMDSITAAIEKLGPVIDVLVQRGLVPLLEKGLAALPGAIDAVAGALDTMVPMIERFFDIISSGDLGSILEGFGVDPAVAQAFEGLADVMGRLAGTQLSFSGDVFGDIGTQVSAFVQENGPLINDFMATVINAMSQVREYTIQVIQVLAAGLGPAISGIVAGILDLVKAIMQLVTGDFSGAFDSLISAGKKAADGVIKGIVGMSDKILELLGGPSVQEGIAIWKNNWEMLKTIVTTVFQIIVNSVTGFFTGIGESFTTGAEGVKSGWDALWTGLGDNIQAVFDAVGEIVQGAISGLEAWLGISFAEIGAQWAEIWNGIVMIAQELLARLGETIMTLLTPIITFIITTIITFNEAWNTAWTAVAETAAAIWGAIVSMITTFVNNIWVFLITFITNIIEYWIEQWWFLVSGMQVVFAAIITAIIEVAQQIAVEVTNGVQGAVDAVLGFIGAMANAGHQLIQGLIDGVGEMAEAFINAVTNLAKQAVNALLAQLGIESPSKVTHQMGVYLGQGLIDGIESMQNKAAQAASSLAKSTTAAMSFSGGDINAGNNTTTVYNDNSRSYQVDATYSQTQSQRSIMDDLVFVGLTG